MMPLSYQASCLISNLKKSSTMQAAHSRKLSLERISKRRKSLPVLPSYLSVLTMTSSEKKKQRKGVKFPLGVLMQQAVTDGDVQEIRQLITEHGLQAIEEREPIGLPPVMRAIFEGQLGCLKLLIDAGADLTVRDPENWTPLHVAAAMDDVEAAEMILSSCKSMGHLLETKNVDAERPIDMAESVEMARLLLHADLRELRAEKAVAEAQAMPPAQASDSEESVIQLVHNHCKKYPDCSALNSVLKSNTCFDTLMHLAATKNYPHLADYLCRHHLADLETRDRRGWTALHTAAYYNSVDIVIVLAEYGANTHSLTHSYEKPSDLTEHELIQSILEEEHLADSL